MKTLILTLCLLGNLEEDKYVAANNLYNITWNYYKEKRVGSAGVYWHSKYLLQAEIELKHNIVEAHKHHLARMLEMQDIVLKVKALGRSNTLEVAELKFYIAEAKLWLVRETNDKRVP